MPNPSGSDESLSGTSPQLALFSSPGGVVAIRSPVKLRILSLLEGGGMGFDEIVAGCGRAKSTVSVHLHDLIEEGVLGARVDEQDARRKKFYLTAGSLGSASSDSRLQSTREVNRALFQGKDPEPAALFRLILRALRVRLLTEGISLDPVYFSAGYAVGSAIQDRIAAPDMLSFLRNIADFWVKYGLGKVQVNSVDPVVLTVYDCFECSDLPEIGRPACPFDTGFLTALFIAQTGEDLGVTETHCYAMGNGFCRFLIEQRNGY